MDDGKCSNNKIGQLLCGKINPLPFQGRAYKSAFFYLNNLCAKQGFHLVSLICTVGGSREEAGKKIESLPMVSLTGSPLIIEHTIHICLLIYCYIRHFSPRKEGEKTSFRANFGRSGQKVNQELGFESQPSFSSFLSCQRALITQSATAKKKCEIRSIRVMNRYTFLS